MVADGVAQIPADKDMPVWTMEVVKLKPGKFGPTLGYLDDLWMRFREDAKRQGEFSVITGSQKRAVRRTNRPLCY